MARLEDISFSSCAFLGNELAMFGISSFGKFCDSRMAAAVKRWNGEPMTRFAAAHFANKTIESVFHVHYIGRCDEQSILILELV